MYNYYSELKKLNDYESQVINNEKEAEIKEHRKKKMPNLIRNYENRIKDFLYKMAKSPLVIKDHQQAISSTRKDLLDQENHKILAGKGFVLKQFKTEKQRLEERMSIKEATELRYLNTNETSINNTYLSNLSNGDSTMLKLKAYYEGKQTTHGKSSPKINQPTMRFTAKNTVERICDALSIYSYRNPGKEEIARAKHLQMKKNVNERADDDEDEDKYQDNQEALISRDKENGGSISNKAGKRNEKKYNKFEDKKLKIKHYQNSRVRHMLSDLHERTHFNGAAGFTLWKTTSLLKSEVQHKAHKAEYVKENNWEKFQLSRLDSTSGNGNNNYLNNTQTPKLIKNSTHTANNNFRNTYTDQSNNNRITSMKANNFEGIVTNNSNKESTYRFEDYINNPNDNLNNNYLLYKLDIEDDLAKNNPLLYNLTLNNFKKNFENRHEADENKLNYLKSIAFQNSKGNKIAKTDKKTETYFKKIFEKNKSILNNLDSKKKSMLQYNPIGFFEKYKEDVEWTEFKTQNNEEKKLEIYGENIPITALDRIAKKVLIECNFVHPKSKYNQTCHKSGEGKMMFTSGLTVKEFKNKFNLN